jgi:hypothetical protein
MFSPFYYTSGYYHDGYWVRGAIDVEEPEPEPEVSQVITYASRLKQGQGRRLQDVTSGLRLPNGS